MPAISLSPKLLANETVTINGIENATKDVLEALNYGNEPMFSQIPPSWNISHDDFQFTPLDVDKTYLFINDALYDDFTNALFTIPSPDEAYSSPTPYTESLQQERLNLGYNILFDLCHRSQKPNLKTPYAYTVKVLCKFLFWLRENHMGSIQSFLLQMDKTWKEIDGKFPATPD